MADPTGKPAPQPARHGLLRAIVILACLGFLGAVGWVAYCHQKQDGHVSFRIFDLDWWKAGFGAAPSTAQEVTHEASQAGDALWGDHGMFEQASQWWREHRPRFSSASSSANQAPASPERRRLEDLFVQADSEFSDGLDQYHQAEASSSGAANDPSARARLEEARHHLLSVQDLLTRSIPAYQALDGHDTDRLSEEQSLLEYDQRLLASLSKRLGLPTP
jgi:hypothetical protein